jgi:hypothetical protein
MQAGHHSKRFAATVSQLEALRNMLSQYVAAHWRAAHMKEIQKRRVAGAKLIAAQPPEVRLDFTMTQLHAIVDRTYNRHMVAPEIMELR